VPAAVGARRGRRRERPREPLDKPSGPAIQLPEQRRAGRRRRASSHGPRDGAHEHGRTDGFVEALQDAEGHRVIAQRVRAVPRDDHRGDMDVGVQQHPQQVQSQDTRP
jgi:hypothetical protein